MMINKGEGKNLTGSYSWFQDLEVIKNFVQSVDEIADALPEEVNVLGIGSGVGNLEYTVKELLENKHNKKVNLTISDRQTKDTKTSPDVKIIEIDNKNIPFEDDTFDLVIARSVTHYEKDNEDELKVLKEVKRVLKENGFFVTEDPYLSTIKEAELLYKIHSLISKFMNLKDYDKLLAIHKEVFQKVDLANNQPDKSLSIEKNDFIKRYGVNEDITNQIIDLIKQYNSDETPNVWQKDDNFGWSVKYIILICSN